MKMEPTEGSETSAIINQPPGNYPKGNLLNVNPLHKKRCGSADWINLAEYKIK